MLVSGVVFSVARVTPVEGFLNPVPFQQVIVNEGGAFDESTNTLSIPSEGYYFFHLSAGADAASRINYNIFTSGKQADIFRYSTAHNGTDMTSRDVIWHMSAGAQVRMVNEAEYSLYSDADRQTSWSGIDLTAHLNPDTFQAIFVATDRRFSAPQNPLPLDSVISDADNSWVDDSVWEIRHSGIYFLSVSAGTWMEQPARIQLVSADLGNLGELLRSSTSHNAPDTFSRVVMASLVAGDRLYARLEEGETYSDGVYQTSLSGIDI